MHINQARVNELTRSGAPAKIAVGESLYLCVRGEGAAFWVHQYREPGTGKMRGVGFGSASNVTLASAMKLRHRFDPATRPPSVKVNDISMPRAASQAVAGKPFGEALEAWLSERGSKWSAKGVAARRRLVELSVGRMNVAAITQPDVVTALEKETPRQHQDKRGWLADLFSFAKAKRWRVGDNPARLDKDTLLGLDPIEHGASHAAIAWRELPVVFKQLPDALRFLILTAARAGEVEKATWSQVQGDVWTYTVAKGKKRGEKVRQHRVPLSKAALALLGKRRAAIAPLFGALPANALLNALQAVRPDATVHGLRSTFKDWCTDHKVDDILSEVALSHVVGGSTRRSYARSDMLEQRRDLMEKWSRFVGGR